MAERGCARTPRVKSSSSELGSLPENPPCPESPFTNAPESLQIRLPKSTPWRASKRTVSGHSARTSCGFAPSEHSKIVAHAVCPCAFPRTVLQCSLVQTGSPLFHLYLSRIVRDRLSDVPFCF